MDTHWNHMTSSPVFIAWKPEYELGIPIADEQHRGIVSTINSLYYAMRNKQGEKLLQPVIGMVVEYTRIHFEIEVAILRQCGFPDAEHHNQLHSELFDTLMRVGRKSAWDRDPHSFMEFLKAWWISHICDKDRMFRDFLRGRAPRLPDRS